jgi:hypothetical protein
MVLVVHHLVSDPEVYMRKTGVLVLAIAAFSLVTMMTAKADDRFSFAGDAYVSGATARLNEPVERDALLAGLSVSLAGKVEKDAHALGFDVDIDAPVGGDLYAAGFNVKVGEPVGEDLTASGGTVLINSKAAIGGNARLAGGSITIDGPVSGSLMAAGGELKLDSPVAGDAVLKAGTITFGPNAKISGKLHYSAPEPVEIAASVIAPDRVEFTRIERPSQVDMMRESVDHAMPRLWPSFLGMTFGFVISLVFLAAVSAAALAFAPQLSERLRVTATDRPLPALGLGVLGLSTLIGLFPIACMTLIGIPLIPVILLAIVVLWTAGYLVGVYALSWRIATGITAIEATTLMRLIVIVAGLVVFSLVNFIPFLGWLANFAAMLIGLGAIVRLILERYFVPGAKVAINVDNGPAGDGI